MPQLTYMQGLHLALHNMANDGENNVGLKTLIDRIATRRRWANGNRKLAPHYPKLIRRALGIEARAHRIRIEGLMGTQNVVITQDGVQFYKDWQEPNYQRYSILNPAKVETRAEVVHQYNSSARHLLTIQEVFKTKIPMDPRVHDIRNFPLLLRECLETRENLRSTNFDLGEKIYEGNLRIEHLETERARLQLGVHGAVE